MLHADEDGRALRSTDEELGIQRFASRKRRRQRPPSQVNIMVLDGPAPAPVDRRSQSGQVWHVAGSAASFSWALALVLLLAACGATEEPAATLPEPEGFPKAYLGGERWRYARMYSVGGEPLRLDALEAQVTIVLQERILIARLVGDEWQSHGNGPLLAAGWRIVGHVGHASSRCEYVETSMIEPCPAWHQRSHFVPDFASPLVQPSEADDEIVSHDNNRRRRPTEVVVEDGLLVVVQDHEVHIASESADPFVLTVRHRMERAAD